MTCMAAIKGISVTLHEREKTGEDEFHHPIYRETKAEVENVLIAPVNTSEIVGRQDLKGRKKGRCGYGEILLPALRLRGIL